MTYLTLFQFETNKTKYYYRQDFHFKNCIRFFDDDP